MKQSQKRALEIGAGAVAAAALAAAAGAYLLSGKEGAKRKAAMKAWAVKARNEVAKKAKMAKRLTEGEYKRLVDQAIKRYGSLEDMSAKEMIAAGRELKMEWDHIKAHAKKLSNGAKRKMAPAKRKAKKARRK